MKAVEFCYWLQGYFEIRMDGYPSEHIITNEQAVIIRNHLALVFKHDIDPMAGGSKEYQDELQEIHDGTSTKGKLGGIDQNGLTYRC